MIFLGYNLFAERDGGLGDTYSAMMQAGSSLGRVRRLPAVGSGGRIVAAQSAATHRSSAMKDLRLASSGYHALVFDFPRGHGLDLLAGDGISGAGTLGDAIRFAGSALGNGLLDPARAYALCAAGGERNGDHALDRGAL